MSSVAEKLQRKSQRATATKQVRLKLVYVDFWSAVKLSFLMWIVLGIILVVASLFIWLVLDVTGIFTTIDNLLQEVLNQPTFSVKDVVSLPTVGLFSFIVAILNVVIGTVLGAIVALLYNFSVRLTGGLLVGFTNN
jgi:uncharacterized membrane protein